MDETTRLELVDPDTNTRKFWQISVRGGKLTRQWGRIGTLGQTKTEDCRTKDDAYSRYRSDIQGKLNKGYAKVEETKYGTEERFTEQEIDVSKDNLLMLIENL
jgi:predicted DNA-binding WGR domain protein